MSKFRLPEWCKNILILLLSLSALWLVSLSPLYVGSPLETWVQRHFLPEDPVADTAVSLTAAARPLMVSIADADGRYTTRYNATSVESAFDSVTPLLNEALSKPGTTFSISESRWQDALLQPGIYLQFDCAIPVSVFANWMTGEDHETFSDSSSRRFLLAPGELEDAVWLFWQDNSSRRFFACGTSLSRSEHLEPKVEEWLPNASFFAFEDDDYAACAPYTLLADTPQPAVYSASVPLSSSNPAAVEQVLTAFSYSPASGASYAISGGTRYTDGIHTFHLSDSGVLTYHAPAAGVQPASAEAPTLTECIETTRTLLQKTLGQYCGNALLSLASIEQEGSTLILTYEYCLDGIPVTLRQTGWAAQFILTDGSISEFTLHFRSYTASAESTPILPELQASAALTSLDAEGCELLLSYLDSGASTVSAAWLAY